jgi:hypothetical protein
MIDVAIIAGSARLTQRAQSFRFKLRCTARIQPLRYASDARKKLFYLPDSM